MKAGCHRMLHLSCFVTVFLLPRRTVLGVWESPQVKDVFPNRMIILIFIVGIMMNITIAKPVVI